VLRFPSYWRTLGAGALLALVLGSAAPAQAWGPVAHRQVHNRAISALPGELRQFFLVHRRELPTLSEENPASLDEGPERRFAADRFGAYPFPDLPTTEEELIRQNGDSAREAGRLPWLIRASYAHLIESYKKRDKAQVLEAADQLALQLTDLHNPLAVTRNYDGQLSGQPGLWMRVSVRLPEALAAHLDIKPDVAHLIDDPNGYVFDVMRASYVWADNILYEDDLAMRRGGGYGATYFDSLRETLRPLLSARLSAASRTVASYWYSAWLAAGKPSLEAAR
jgi:hypothetical protein